LFDIVILFIMDGYSPSAIPSLYQKGSITFIHHKSLAQSQLQYHRHDAGLK